MEKQNVDELKIIETKRYYGLARDLAYDIDAELVELAGMRMINYWLVDDCSGMKLKMCSGSANTIDDTAVLAAIERNIDKYLADYDEVMYELRETMDELDRKYCDMEDAAGK